MAVVAILILVAVFGMLGDKVAFVRPPINTFERIVAIPTVMAFLLLDDRIYADTAAAGLYGTIFLVVGLILFRMIEHHIIEPMAIKNMIRSKRREKELLNKHNDNTL